MAATTTYRRLPGRTAWFRFGGSNSPSCSLWLGPDHLLKVERSTSRETYKRFFYRDIQSIFVEQSSRLRSLTALNGLIVLFVLILVALISQVSSGGAIFCGGFAVPFVIGLMMNLALGSTCEVVLVTAVGSERLSSLSRLSRTVGAVQQITVEVERAQGALEFAQLVSRWPEPVSTPPVD